MKIAAVFFLVMFAGCCDSSKQADDKQPSAVISYKGELYQKMDRKSERERISDESEELRQNQVDGIVEWVGLLVGDEYRIRLKDDAIPYWFHKDTAIYIDGKRALKEQLVEPVYKGSRVVLTLYTKWYRWCGRVSIDTTNRKDRGETK